MSASLDPTVSIAIARVRRLLRTATMSMQQAGETAFSVLTDRVAVLLW